MDMVYIDQPVLSLFPLVLVLWQVGCWWLKNKVSLSSLADAMLTGVGVAGHAAAITVILFRGGALSDVLLLVLLSGALSMALSPKANEATGKTQEGDE